MLRSLFVECASLCKSARINVDMQSDCVIASSISLTVEKEALD